MISTSEALSLIEQRTTCLNSILISTEMSLGYVLAASPITAIDLPPFDQSAMDGYAIRFGQSNSFKVIGEIKAGDDASSYLLEKGEAIKIFTGGMCPKNCDAVCRIEDIQELENQILIHVLPKSGSNIRITGEQIEKGTSCLPFGTIMNPALIGFLANAGIENLDVFRKPTISIVSTGNELIDPTKTKELLPGKIFESNGVMLKSALEQYGFSAATKTHLQDEYEFVVEGLRKQLELSDVLIISGGISVGDYDFVGRALLEIGVEQVFYKVNQKPGKPFFFGTKGAKLIFALPGNPAAALTCFYVYILPALRKMMGKGFVQLPRTSGKLISSISKPNSREQFLKAKFNHGEVEILEGQSSAMLRAFSDANVLAYIDKETTLDLGDHVDLILL